MADAAAYVSSSASQATARTERFGLAVPSRGEPGGASDVGTPTRLILRYIDHNRAGLARVPTAVFTAISAQHFKVVGRA